MHISFGKFTCAGVTLLITSELHWIAAVPIKTEYNVSNRSCFSCSLCMRCFLSIYNMCHPAPGFDVLAPESLIHQYLTQWKLSTLSKCIMYSVLGTEMQAESPNLCENCAKLTLPILNGCCSVPTDRSVPLYRYSWQARNIWSCLGIPEYITPSMVSVCFIASEGINGCC